MNVKPEIPKNAERVEETAIIRPVRHSYGKFLIEGISPLVVRAFSNVSRDRMIRDHQAGSLSSKKSRKKEPRDFEAEYHAARHISDEGWDGIPSQAFRLSGIRAANSDDFKMTTAKMTFDIIEDGYSRSSGDGLVRITKGEPHMDIRRVRIGMGKTDLCARPMWRPGWQASVQVRWNADVWTATDMLNIFHRLGDYVGVCEGRPTSPKSGGCGWGRFKVVDGDISS